MMTGAWGLICSALFYNNQAVNDGILVHKDRLSSLASAKFSHVQYHTVYGTGVAEKMNRGIVLLVHLFGVVFVFCWAAACSVVFFYCLKFVYSDRTLRDVDDEKKMFGESIEDKYRAAIMSAPKGSVCIAFTDVEGESDSANSPHSPMMIEFFFCVFACN